MVIVWAPRWEKKEKKIGVVEKKNRRAKRAERYSGLRGALGSL